MMVKERWVKYSGGVKDLESESNTLETLKLLFFHFFFIEMIPQKIIQPIHIFK